MQSVRFVFEPNNLVPEIVVSEKKSTGECEPVGGVPIRALIRNPFRRDFEVEPTEPTAFGAPLTRLFAGAANLIRQRHPTEARLLQACSTLQHSKFELVRPACTERR